MKINFLLPHYGYRPSGGVKVVYIYANEFVKLGHEVNIIHAAYCKTGIRNLFALIETILGRKSKTDWFQFERNVHLFYTGSLCEKNIPDADVTIATAYETSFFLNKYSSKKGEKIYFIQGWETWAASPEQILSTWKYDMKKVIISKWLQNIGERERISNMFYVPNAIDKQVYRLYQGYENRTPSIAMVYSPAAVKGVKYALPALCDVKRVFPNIRIVFFGRNKKAKEIPEWIEYYENPQQSFIVQEIYNKVSIFVCSSLGEGWGLPPMEAMACGAAVVTTDCGGVGDFAIHEETAIVCPIKDSTALRDGILRLLNDDELRGRIVKNALNKVEEFDWEKSTLKFLSIIKEQ